MMKKIILFFIIIIFQSNISNAKISTKNSNEMNSWCKLWIKQDNGQRLSEIEMVKAIGCSWYFKGMFESSLFSDALKMIREGNTNASKRQLRLNGTCVPSSITAGQWVRIFVKYLDENPQHLNRGVTINSSAALRRYYKCRK